MEEKITALEEQLNTFQQIIDSKFAQLENDDKPYFSSGDKLVIKNIMQYLAKEGYTVEDANKILDATKVELTRMILTEDNPIFSQF